MKTTFSYARSVLPGRAGNFLPGRREVLGEAEQNVAPGEMRIQGQERDDVLLRRAAKGDEEAFTLLYRRNQASYLFGIARNRVMKCRERAPREVSLEEKREDGSDRGIVLQDKFTPATWTEQRERLEQVRAAVLELPAEFRETVVLCELEELSYEQAAQSIGCPVGTIRSRLHRGRALLLAKLEMLRDVPRRANAAR